MNIIKRCIFLAFALTIVGAASIASAQYTLTTLATFNGTNGGQPQGQLLADASGNLYGTTVNGSTNGNGIVFEVTAGTHALNTLVSFGGTNSINPAAGLIADASGNLYGMTSFGGHGINGSIYDYGTVFEVAAGTHALSTLVAFNGTNGADPKAGLIADASGNLYGTTSGGNSGQGTVFEVAAGTHALSTLVSFNGTNGAMPLAGLIADASGNLYGTTTHGGANKLGTVFEVAAGTHALSTLVSFNGTNGAIPLAGLSADARGNLYGTTYQGGANNQGTVFELAAGTHALSTLASFNGMNSDDDFLLVDTAGNLFGTTYYGGANGVGTVFEVAAGTHALSTLVTFDGTNGAYPYNGLIADANGNLYGTTTHGGAGQNGTVFELSPVPEPASLVLAACGLAMGASTIRRR